MKKLPKAAVLTALRDELDARGNWCGETHIQKTAYFLQEAAGVPLGYDFILYKHGPFSFDLREELTEFRSDGFLDLQVQVASYGPKLIATAKAKRLQEKFPNTLNRHQAAIKAVADFVGSKGVVALERLATALMLLKESPEKKDAELATELRAIKPHVEESSALQAVRDVRAFQKRLDKLLPSTG